MVKSLVRPKLIKRNNKRYIEYKGRRYRLVSDKPDNEILKNVLEILKELRSMRKKKRITKKTKKIEKPISKNAPNPEATGSSNAASSLPSTNQMNSSHHLI